MDGATLNLPEDLREALDRAVAAIVEIAHPELVILFGSWAEGTARPDSDLDLLVVADYEDRGVLAGRLRMALWPILAPHDFDLLLYSPEAWQKERRLLGFVARQAERKGRPLYAAA